MEEELDKGKENENENEKETLSVKSTIIKVETNFNKEY
jgi:hypothetical protein